MQRYDHGGDVYSQPGITLDFSVNINPLGMPSPVKEALIRTVGEYVRYPDPHCRELTRALAGVHGVSPENILCGNGAADLIFRILAARSPRQVLILAPTFSEYERPAVLFGGQIREYRLDPARDFALTEDFLEALTPELDMVFLCNPNNPTGRLAPAGLMQEIAVRCRKNATALVVDECFLPLSSGTSMIPMLEEFPDLFILRAFTKLYAMAGLRLGYLLGEGQSLAGIARFGAEWSVSVPAQVAGLAALDAEPEWSERTNRLIRKERDWMMDELSLSGITVFPSDTNFLLLRHEIPLYRPLKERGILVRDCSNFTGLDEHHIRIGLKTRAENQQLIEAIREIIHG